MLRKAALLFSLILFYAACASPPVQVTVSSRSNGDAWKNSYGGEEIFVVTQGTVAVEIVELLNREIPSARWTARFDYDRDISGNYLVLDYQQEKSGTPLTPVISAMFSGYPAPGTLQVNSNRIRLGYFSEEIYEGWTDSLERILQAYAGFLANSDIEETQGPWYADPLAAYLRDRVDKATGERFLTSVNYTTGEERDLLRYELIEEPGNGVIPWTVKIHDTCGHIEWVSGLIAADERAGRNMTGFYGAIKESAMEFSAVSPRTWSTAELSLGQVDVEFDNDLIMTWVDDRSLRHAVPDNYSQVRVTGVERGFLVSGFDFSGNAFPLFLIAPDYANNRVHIETYRKIRTLELPLIFNETESSGGIGRSFTFKSLRADFTQDLYLPVRNLQSVRIGSVEGDGGFVDLHDGRFFSLTDSSPSEDASVLEENMLILYSNKLPFGNMEFVPELISFYPELDILDVESDLDFVEGGQSEYYIKVRTSPMEPGTTYQVSIQAHPALFGESYLWEFRAPG